MTNYGASNCPTGEQPFSWLVTTSGIAPKSGITDIKDSGGNVIGSVEVSHADSLDGTWAVYTTVNGGVAAYDGSGASGGPTITIKQYSEGGGGGNVATAVYAVSAQLARAASGLLFDFQLYQLSLDNPDNAWRYEVFHLGYGVPSASGCCVPLSAANERKLDETSLYGWTDVTEPGGTWFATPCNLALSADLSGITLCGASDVACSPAGCKFTLSDEAFNGTYAITPSDIYDTGQMDWGNWAHRNFAATFSGNFATATVYDSAGENVLGQCTLDTLLITGRFLMTNWSNYRMVGGSGCTLGGGTGNGYVVAIIDVKIRLSASGCPIPGCDPAELYVDLFKYYSGDYGVAASCPVPNQWTCDTTNGGCNPTAFRTATGGTVTFHDVSQGDWGQGVYA